MACAALGRCNILFVYRTPSTMPSSSTVFTNNRTQAVRLPADVRLPDNVKKVEVVALGRARLIVPAGEAWDSWFDGEGVTPDFMTDREQPQEQDRTAL